MTAFVKQPGLWCLALLLCFGSGRLCADWWWSGDDDAPAQQPQVQVAEPFTQWRSGPGSMYPVIHSSERGEWLTLHKRKTSWIQVTDDEGREGWVHVDDILLTKDGRGRKVQLQAPRFDDFRTRRWEAGLMMGEFDSTAVNAAYAGYWLTEQLSAEFWASQILGNASEIRMANINLLHQPFSNWRVSPFFTLGFGHIFIKPKATLAQSDDRDDSTAHVGVGLRYYVTERYFLRMEVKDYKVFTKRESNEEATEWKIGLSVFF